MTFEFSIIFNPSIRRTFKGRVKILFLPVIALSFLFFCPKLEQALHKQQILKNAILCVGVVSDQLCNANGPPAQVQHDELVTRLSFRETMEFLQTEVFVL